MSSPFGRFPKFREYLDWAEKDEKCKVTDGIVGLKRRFIITAPNGKTVTQIGLLETETLAPATIANMDRRLGLDSPFPKTPEEPT